MTQKNRRYAPFRVLGCQIPEQEIAAYADTEEPYDKAGAYGIQGAFGVRYVSGIRGDYYNVVGLPVPRLCQELKAMLG